MANLQLFYWLLALIFLSVGQIVFGLYSSKCNGISSRSGEMNLILNTTCGKHTNDLYHTVKSMNALGDVKYSGCGDELELFWSCYTFCTNRTETNDEVLTTVECNCSRPVRQDVHMSAERTVLMTFCGCTTKRKKATDHSYVQEMPTKEMLCSFERDCLEREFITERKCMQQLGSHSSQTHDIGDEEAIELGED